MPLQDSRARKRQGKVIVLSAFLMIPVAGMAAFAIDVGHIGYVRNDCHRAADMAALAGAMRLRGSEAQHLAWALQSAYYKGDNNIRATAEAFVEKNKAGSVTLACERNIGNFTSGDIVIGYINPRNTSAAMTYNGPIWNSVRVTTYRNSSHSGSLSLFLGKVMGREQQDITATATATLTSNAWGKILPIVINVDDWNRLFDSKLDKDESDYYTYNPDLNPISDTNYSNRIIGNKFSPAPDSVRELRIYPDKQSAPGNFGTVDFGHLSGSTADIVRQINSGLSPDDRAQMALQGLLDLNGRLVANLLRKLDLSGDPGVSWTIENDLAAIVGQTRTIPVYDLLSYQGTQAVYRIIGFVNVVICEAGTEQAGNKLIRIQPVAPFTILESPDDNGLGRHIALTR